MQPLSKTLRALFLGVALISMMVACVSYTALRELRRPAGTSSEPVQFVVESGESTSAIATKLADAKLIRFPLLFSFLVRNGGYDGSLKAGSYALRPNMTISEIIASLQVSQQFDEVQIQVIEGLRLEEIAAVVGQAGLPNVSEQDFLDAASDGSVYKENHFLLSDLPPGADLEGYLFPDTYRVRSDSTAEDVVETMLANFDQQYASFETEVRVERNVHEIVTMASIIQREAGSEGEMPKIAAAFWNRLRPEFEGETGGGKLQADPTLQYALGKSGDWWPNINNLSIDEINNNNDPYNTRARAGLPPGPISNPGIAALQAAAQPDDSQRWFYFVASCTEPGAHNFATTFEDFQRLEQEFLACQPAS